MSAGGRGPEGVAGRLSCWCLISISRSTSEEGGAKLLEVRALMALLYWPFWAAILALLMLDLWLLGRVGETGDDCALLRLRRDLPLAKASDHKDMRSPASHL